MQVSVISVVRSVAGQDSNTSRARVDSVMSGDCESGLCRVPYRANSYKVVSWSDVHGGGVDACKALVRNREWLRHSLVAASDADQECYADDEDDECGDNAVERFRSVFDLQ